MRSLAATALVAAMVVTAGGAQAADYEKAVVSSVSDYATLNEFAGVTLNVACRRLPAMDFISSHMDIFEKATGVKIHFTNYPENEERSKIVADASNHIGGFQIYCLDNDYIPLFAANKWVAPLDSAIKPAYKLDDIFDSLRKSYTWDGGLYGLPIYSEVTILYYRKDLFAAAGLKPPTTMQELEA
ncbi:MAG: ABC transporter substrate-binding protein, partial [Acetobacteraceae bacterium]